MRSLVSLMFIVAGVIHLLPVSGALGSEQLGRLYGVSLSDPNLVILMRHRAVLFALLGLLLVIAAFRRSLRPAALIAGLVSAISFLWIAWSVGGYNAQLSRVFAADVVALASLLVAAAGQMYVQRRSRGDRQKLL